MLKQTCSYLSIIASIFMFSSPTIADSAVDLPDIGTTAAATLTIDQELIYGDTYMRMIRSHYPIVNDPVINEYADSLGHRLVASADDVKTPFHFFVIRDRNINAFAFFGGYVALNSGLFLHAQSESEFASVLAHEIAHVTQRHLARSMEAQARRSPTTMAALVGSLLLAIVSPEAGIAAMTATSAGSIQGGINYTRANEKEADRFGMNTLVKAGFDPMAMPRFFGRLADEYRYASTPPPMLLTHPLPESRITDSRERAQHYPSVKLPFSSDYHLTKARIVARYSNIDSTAALDWFNRAAKKASAEKLPSLEYGKLLVYIDSDQLDLAEPILKKLIANDPNNNFYLDAQTDYYIARKQPAKAVATLAVALKKKPNNPVLLLNYAHALIEAGQNKEAVGLLQRYSHDNPNDTNGWSMLSKANANLNVESEELASRAEILALQADWNSAIQYYTQASQLAPLGGQLQARYDARIDQLMSQRDRFMKLQ